MSKLSHELEVASEQCEREPLAGVLFRRFPKWLRRVKLYRTLRAISNPGAQLIRLNNGLAFYGNLYDGGPAKAIIQQSFDPELSFLLHRLMPKQNGIFFDVGANYGLASLSLHQVYGHKESSYHLFEANQELISILHRSLARSEGMLYQLNYAVVSDSAGTSALSCNSANSGAGFAESYQGVGVPISNLILSEYVRERELSNIDVLKIDIEGYEVKALRGLFSGIEVRPKFLVMEVDSGHLSRASSSVSELFTLLKANGYDIFHWRAQDYDPNYRWNSFCLDRNSSEVRQVNGAAIRLTPREQSIPAASEKWGTDILAIHSGE